MSLHKEGRLETPICVVQSSALLDSSALNPIIYGFMCTSFRESFLKSVCGCSGNAPNVGAATDNSRRHLNNENRRGQVAAGSSPAKVGAGDSLGGTQRPKKSSIALRQWVSRKTRSMRVRHVCSTSLKLPLTLARLAVFFRVTFVTFLSTFCLFVRITCGLSMLITASATAARVSNSK